MNVGEFRYEISHVETDLPNLSPSPPSLSLCLSIFMVSLIPRNFIFLALFPDWTKSVYSLDRRL